MKFNSILQLIDNFDSEEKCRERLEQLRWGGNITCPFCGSSRYYKFNDGKTYKCAHKDCHKKYNATVGTIFENTKIPLRKWFIAIYLLTSHKKGISSLQLGRDLDVTQKTAWFILHRVRVMLAEKAPELLSSMVEVDETFVGGKNKNRHKNKKVPKSTGRSFIDKTPIIGILERGGRLITQVVPDTTAISLVPIVERFVAPGTVICTDEWSAYRFLNRTYDHNIVNHGGKQYVNGEFHTNTVEGAWSLLKRGIIGIYHSVSRKHLHRYADEFTFRYNERKVADCLRWEKTIENSNGKRLKYKELIG